MKLLEQWGEERGEIGVEWAVKLTRQRRDWVPVPDLLYVSYQRLSPEWNQDEVCPVAPELVIEIISPEQTFGQLAAKARDYLDAKVLRVWVVDSKAKSITVFRLGLKEYQVRDKRSRRRHLILVFCVYTFLLWHTLTGGLRPRWANKALNTFTDALSAFRTAKSFRFVKWLNQNGDVFSAYKASWMLCVGLNFV
ncbi:Uma2 family endonuclease [Microcoleus sp. D2_18a_D3]|uniref:Uma2 family endonuclease n=1 Tax=Microcoleus sp. D2_18a_D3 TaxID=3055330 RepID=UPI00403FC015